MKSRFSYYMPGFELEAFVGNGFVSTTTNLRWLPLDQMTVGSNEWIMTFVLVLTSGYE